MSNHKITAARSGHHPSMGDWDEEFTITFSFTPGSPDTYDASRTALVDDEGSDAFLAEVTCTYELPWDCESTEA